GVGPQGVPRRWVTYAERSDPTTVPPEWHGWLHYTSDVVPDERGYVRRAWQRPHKPNMTGTADAYRPKGSLARPAASADEKGNPDYIPWTPDGS
ncbi:MAG: NADH-ubiquinone oxidoreductase subunit NDUFA12 family protein, partial [Pseudomonadota bacterium]